MKRLIAIGIALSFCGTGFAQEGEEVIEESTEITTTEEVVPGEVDLLSRPLWSFEDATPLKTGRVDLRLTSRWETASGPANRGDSHDDVLLQPTIFWGAFENFELRLGLPVWLGDGSDTPSGADGNADISVGFLYRLFEQKDLWPAFAISGTIRTPSGRRSNGVDGEVRFVFTNEYSSGIRSHINGFVTTVNGNNEPDLRNFQWGVVLGLDGPLCANGDVRWVADYMHRSSYRRGAANINQLELGWEWQIADAHKFGMGTRVGLDDNGDTPNFGIGLTYSFSILN